MLTDEVIEAAADGPDVKGLGTKELDYSYFLVSDVGLSENGERFKSI